MKYKIGDEVLVKCRINYVDNDVSLPYKVSRAGCISGFSKPLYILAGDDDIETMTAEEAWEIARRIVGCREHGLEETKRREIFSRDDAFDVFNLFSAKEAKAKIEAWEAEKDIKVGDIVRPKTTKEREYMVTYISESRKLAGVCLQTGEVIPEAFEVSADSVVKTGRHIDIEGILKQIGGSDA